MMAEELVCTVAPLAAVLRLAEKYPVFPCRRHPESVTRNGRELLLKPKSPLTARGFHDATQDGDQIRAWWRRWPEALVGVPTGRTTGLVVIDYDAIKADALAQEWVGEHTTSLLATRTHATLSGGRHYLYRLPDGLRYSSSVNLALGGAKRTGIDLRGEGGYVIWWPLHSTPAEGAIAPLPAGLIDEYRIEPHELPALPDRAPGKWEHDRPLLAAALAYCDPSGYPLWSRAGMAIHLASGGSDEGFALWHAWSAGEITGDCPRSYGGIEVCRHHWASYRHEKDREHTATLGTLFHTATAAGWIHPKRAEPPPGELPPLEVYADEWQGQGESEPASPETAPLVLRASRYPWLEPAEIPPREWLYGYHYMRGMVSATAGMTGAGKSTVTIVEVVSMALGVDLMRGRMPLPAGPLRVWYHNGEDPLLELQRRFQAVFARYSVTREELGDRLRVTSGRDARIVVAAEVHKTVAVFEDVRAALVAELKAERIDALTVDPFVATHRVPENDNTAMEQVMTVYRDVAEEARCAVELTHHFRKTNGAEPSVEDLRGASSIISAARSVRVIACMTEAEAQAAEVNPEERGRYLWLANPKGNMTPSSRRRHWRYIDSVNLHNARDPYPADEIGVAVEWTHPGVAVNNLSPAERRQIISAIGRADPLKARAAPNSKAWAGYLVAEVLDLDPESETTKAQVRNILSTMELSKALTRKMVNDPVKGRSVPIYAPAEHE